MATDVYQVVLEPASLFREDAEIFLHFTIFPNRANQQVFSISVGAPYDNKTKIKVNYT